MAKSQQKRQAKVGFPKRGDIYLVNFDPALGHEIKKTRPALVLQNDIGNEYSLTTIVAAITSKISTRPYPVEVVLQPGRTGLSVPSTVKLDQIRTIDRLRLMKRLGSVDPETMEQIEQALQISLGLIAV
ncbi:MAG: type II toxin-antitoxin system PemK/MazF family toxin [Acidobacteria bacterium]|nr:type II toxin-antitoxin system PemK/MazF family toxin [Acidobacteriota bacterium]